MTEVSIDTSEAAVFAEALKKFKFSEDLEWGMELASQELEGILRDRTGHGATGQAAAGWKHFVEVSPHEVVGVVRNVKPYVDVLDRGSRAGPWRGLPPWKSSSSGIGLWVRRVLGLSGKRANQAAFLIARKIKEEGFPSHSASGGWYEGYAEDAVRKFGPRIARILDMSADRALKRLTK